MIGNNLPQLTGAKRSLLVLLATGALFTSGCSNMLSTAPGSNLVSNAKSISGKVHGGSQPISGATVTLYYAGQNSLPTEAATTLSAADGTFSFTNSGTTGGAENTYSCPSNTNPLVYVVSRGGNTLGDGNTSESNTAAAFIGIYGLCSSLTSSNFITLNEVTTVATMLAVQQYYFPAVEGLASDGSGASKIAIDNTPATIANLANVQTGTVVNPSISLSGPSNLAVSVTATPEFSKINLMANILTSCVNNASASAPNCLTLFSSAAPGGNAQATDVMQALYYMLVNPANHGSTNLASLFALAGGNAVAFQPALAVQPSDWTVAISYSSSSNCANGGALIGAPSALSIDLDGNVWIGNGQTTNGNVVELSSSGTPMVCNSFGSGANAAPSALFIDNAFRGAASGNVWSALSGSSTITRYSVVNKISLAFTAPGPVLAIAGDGPGDIFFTVPNGLYEIPALAAAAATTSAPVQIPSVVTSDNSLMPDKPGMPDTAGNLWASTGTSSTFQQISGGTVTPFTATANTQGIAVTSSNGVYVSSVTPGNSISYFANVAGSLLSSWTADAPLGGLNQPTAIAVDGASNVWSANRIANPNPAVNFDPTAPPTQFGVTEINVSGNPVSPDTASGGFQKSASYLNGSSSIIVDQSGNVWVAGAVPSNNFITEIVGIAAPIFQPYSLGLIKGTFQTAP
jgi:hypothetical protein